MNAISNVAFSMVFLWIVALKDSEGADLESRCPQILNYEEQIEEDRWRAVLELKNHEGSQGIWVNVALDRKAIALINRFGLNTTLNNQNFQISNPEYSLLPGASLKIRFAVIYNKDDVPPTVTSIRLNGVEICDSSKGTCNAVNEAATENLININKSSECGLKTQTEFLVDNGKKADERWSWHIAIMTLKNDTNDYRCGGTLISAKFVLTAAHCVTVPGSNKPLDSDQIIVYLGITHLSDPGPYLKLGVVRRIVVHNEYSTRRYHNDLAMVEMYEPVEFNDYIKPVCLWDGDVQIGNLVGKFGTIVGWGVDNSNQTATQLVEGTMSVVALETCLYHDPNFFAQYTSPKTFCAGRPNEHWPWHIAIMILRSSKYDYHCGGTLVSTKSILTAAHCVTVLGSNKLIDSDRFILYLGITHLSDPGPYFKVRLVRRVVVHNEYNPSRYHNDLAVMEISEPVEFNDYIKPVCLWDGDVQIANLVGKFGTIVGWGIDNSNQTTADLMEAKMPVVALDVCLYHDPNFFAQFTSPKTFCAGGPNGTAVCSGDSGGGMVFPRPGTLGAKEIWYLRGVVSVSPRDGESVCNTKSYSVFSDVAQHINWVQRTAGIK